MLGRSDRCFEVYHLGAAANARVDEVDPLASVFAANRGGGGEPDAMQSDQELSDAFDLQRFVSAQESVFPRVLDELRAGEKRTHWIWFIFPQLRELGRSSTAQFYGIASLAEARAYLAHAQLGQRLIACVGLVLDLRERTLHAIFGTPDDVKFRSSMTLFELAAHTPDNVFTQALDRYCAGRRDDATLELLDTTTTTR